VDRCLSGEPAAWTALYQLCHEPLLAAIRSFIREAAADASLVDEIAARVWYSVICNDGERLARFDVSRGCRLTTFLSVLAKGEARQHFRSENRRRVREHTASRPEGEARSWHRTMPLASEEEFLRTLTRSERTYYETVLVRSLAGDSAEEYSAENSWQLRRRVRKKLDRFLQGDA
jgi:hypothetical protein